MGDKHSLVKRGNRMLLKREENVHLNSVHGETANFGQLALACWTVVGMNLEVR